MVWLLRPPAVYQGVAPREGSEAEGEGAAWGEGGRLRAMGHVWLRQKPGAHHGRGRWCFSRVVGQREINNPPLWFFPFLSPFCKVGLPLPQPPPFACQMEFKNSEGVLFSIMGFSRFTCVKAAVKSELFLLP